MKKVFKIAFVLIGLAVYTGLLGHYIDATENANIGGLSVQEKEAFEKANTSLLPQTVENIVVTFSGSSGKTNVEINDWHTTIFSSVFKGFHANTLNTYVFNWGNALVLSNHLNQIFPFHSFW